MLQQNQQAVMQDSTNTIERKASIIEPNITQGYHRYLWLVGCVRFNVPLDTFLGHFGDGGVTAASARIIAAASAEASSPAQPHSVCSVE